MTTTEQVPTDFDVIVLGLGPGGEEVAGRLASAGLQVLGIDHGLVGGECPYWGCVPSKMMIRAAGVLAEARRVPQLAGRATVEPDYRPVAARIRQEATDDWNDQVAVDRLVGKGATFLRGTGRLAGPGAVAVGDREFRARRGVVLATGTVPAIPPVPGLAGTPYWTNRHAIEATEPPGSLLVLGGGAIGLELAQVFARFGSRVTVLEAADTLLPMEEPEAGRLLAGVLARDGIAAHTGTAAQQVSHDGSSFVVGAGALELRAEQLLVATGRRVDLAALGVDTVGLDPAARSVPVDARMRAADGLWAVGDITGKGAFTHVAMYQADLAVGALLGEDRPAADYRALPRVTFTDPEVGAVGMTERQAAGAGLAVRTGTAQVPSTARGWIHQAGNDGFIKLVEDAHRGVLVGATSAGPTGGEVLGALAVAVQARVPTAVLRHTIWAYPTIHRGIGDALRDLT